MEKYTAEIWNKDHWHFWASCIDYHWLFKNMKKSIEYYMQLPWLVIEPDCSHIVWRITNQDGVEV